MPHALHAVLRILAIALLGMAPAQATLIMAETLEGKVVRLELDSWGTIGKFGKATLTITGKDGKQIFHEEFDSAAQFAEGMHNGKDLVVFRTIGEKSEVHLSFLGTHRELETHEELEKVLKDPKRKKDPGNSLMIQIPETQKTYSFKDIVCLLEIDP